MQMAAGGGPCGAHARDDLADLHGIAGMHGYGFKVVVCGDESIAVINFHPVAAAPWVPAHGPDHTRIRRVNPGAAGCRVVLAQVEVSGTPGDRADAQAKGRTLIEDFKRCHKGSLWRPFKLDGRDIELLLPAFGNGPDHGPAERDQGPGIRQEPTRPGGLVNWTGTNAAGSSPPGLRGRPRYANSKK
ncbi:hypothetical protein QFZ30_003553 [Arthrobacter pascens]|nr:hypothetical protein [Arthrobacter pascens]MDQ0680171.1 hypothetical protein [Arthrobacter pascens]